MSGFVHLHAHTQYSVLDGANKIKELVAKAAALGHKAVGITDHGNMHGAVEFYLAAKSAGIKPIIGCEIYITKGDRRSRVPVSQGGAPTFHMTLLSANLEGYKNLCKLVSFAYLEGFYFKPRIDWELLEKHHEGLFCLSGCMTSELASYTRREDISGARECIERYHTLFGDRYYLEVMPHPIKEQQMHNRAVRLLGDEMGIPLVATNDCHYPSTEDQNAHEVLMCISTGKLLSDEGRLSHPESRMHFKTEEEMLAELPGFGDAVANTVKIADECNLEFDFSTYHMPQFELESGQSLEEAFEEKARSGLAERLKIFKSKPKSFSPDDVEIYRARLELEIELIKKMGFAGYFLVVSDFILWAKRNDIPVGPGRGSAAGSLVAYAMSITEIDPIENKLLFERFLNPERVSLPDIDVDFCILGRDRVIDYVSEKYGRDKVAQIVTFGTLKAKAAIKDVGRVLGLSYAETDRIAKLIPAPRQGFDHPLSEALQMEKRLREYADGEGKELIELALKLEGLARHTSTHAAGLVISDRPIVEYMPLMVDKDGQVVTQFSMNWVEKIGLVKFDFLGLKTLTVLHEAVRMIREQLGVKIELNELDLEDDATYRLISSGSTIGVFQLESSGITEMVGRLKPNCFEDIVAILALYRPGPLDAGMVDHYINRKHGREKVRYLHALLEPILSDTYGIILYQEQIMQIARDLGGYTLGEADMLRRAMGKKKPEEMAKNREMFVRGAASRGISNALASEIFDQMETFARYGFNRSHSVAYAAISFQTAYLKAHYPRQFMAALMTYEMDDTDKILKNLNECREMDIEVSGPDVNRGQVGFTAADSGIVFGLAGIKGIGEKAVELIVAERKAGGAFKSFYDFCCRADQMLLNKRCLESFIKAGAFDWSGASRAELLERYEEVLKGAQKARAERESNQIGLFGAPGKGFGAQFEVKGESIPEWPVSVKLTKEREALGFYLSGHPLERFRRDLELLGSLTVGGLRNEQDGAQVTVAGIITFLKLKNTKKGDRYATFVLEDLLDTVEVIVWPDIYQKVQALLSSEDPVLVSGRVDISDERITVVASTIESAITRRDRSATEAIVMLDGRECSKDKLEKLRGVLAGHQGKCQVKIVFRLERDSDTPGADVAEVDAHIAVEPSEALCNRVERIFGRPVLTFR